MSSSKFTPEEMQLLREHPYIIEVSPRKACLSREFKEIVWNEMQKGRNIYEIFTEYGLPCDILGKTRIDGMKSVIRREGKNGKGFRDVHSLEYQDTGFKSPEKEIEVLKMKLAYKDQEIEFLKKIVSLGQGESTR